jgi:hypothetical protein
MTSKIIPPYKLFIKISIMANFIKATKVISITKRVLTLLIINISLVLFSNDSFAQSGTNYENAKKSLVKLIKKKYLSEAFSKNIDRFYSITCDSLVKKNFLLDGKPIKDVLTVFFLISEKKINNKSIALLRIPALNYNFLTLLKVYKKSPVYNRLNNIGTTQTIIFEEVFLGLNLGDSIRTFNGLRKMINDPYYISSNIQLPQYKPYKDTLLNALANGAPEILIRKLAENDTVYTRLVERSNNISVKLVSKIKMDKDYEKILPFSMAVYENRISVDSIKKLLLTPADYYHAFVNETVRLHRSPDPRVRSFLRQPIADINIKNANHYFIKQINDLHESPDNIRFSSLNNLPLIDLYFILVAGKNELVIGGSDALYTSSFLYVFKKFLKAAETEGMDKFFDEIGYYQFETFISNISDYGMVDQLVSNLNEEKVTSLFGKYLTDLAKKKQLNDNEVMLKSMTMAEVLYEMRRHEGIKNSLVAVIDKIIKQPDLQSFFMYLRMYRGFKDILLDKNDYNSDDSYDVLQVQRLKHDDKIIQACFFYDDEDGISSFASSTGVYNARQWDKKDMGSYILFTSKTGNNMRVYMNKPNTKSGCDSAQNEMLEAIKLAGYEITSYIHRGHSYHLNQSLRKITGSGQFVFLGSCGGYSQVLKVFELNPDVNIIATRSVGTKQINDPLLGRINSDIVQNKDINWDALWKEFNARFQSKQTKDLFSAYVPPNKYIGIKFIRQVFDY